MCAYVWVDEDFDLALRGGARSVKGPNDLRHHRTNKTKQHTPRDCARTLSGKRVCNHRINQIIMIAPYHIRGKCGGSWALQITSKVLGLCMSPDCALDAPVMDIVS